MEQVEIQVPHVQNNIEVHNPQQNLDLPVDAQQLVRFSRSGREIRKPSRYILMGESYQAILIDHDNDPISYNEALEDVDVQEWLKAMNREMKSMYSNSVWTLVEAPKRVKPIRCKWTYKRKRRPDGKVETFKAILMVEGYTQKRV